MLIPKKNRIAIYEYLFTEGVIVAKKDFNLASHPDFAGVPNLQVIKACQSLRSRNYVRETFSWQHYYYYLTDEGIMYLRDYLHLPIEIVPSTLKKSPREAAPRPMSSSGERRGDRESGRSGYRGGDSSGSWREKKVGAGEDFKPSYRGGAGRGYAPPS